MNDDKLNWWDKSLAMAGVVVAIGALVYYGNEYIAAHRTLTAVPAKPAIGTKPALVTPTIPALDSAPIAEPVAMPATSTQPAGDSPAVIPGVGINPHPGVYPPGWGPCPEGTNSYGPAGAFGWGCPLGR